MWYPLNHAHKLSDNDGDGKIRSPWNPMFWPDIQVLSINLCTNSRRRAIQLTWIPALWISAISIYIGSWHLPVIVYQSICTYALSISWCFKDYRCSHLARTIHPNGGGNSTSKLAFYAHLRSRVHIFAKCASGNQDKHFAFTQFGVWLSWICTFGSVCTRDPNKKQELAKVMTSSNQASDRARQQ